MIYKEVLVAGTVFLQLNNIDVEAESTFEIVSWEFGIALIILTVV